MSGGDGAELATFAAGPHQQQVAVEQPRFALAQAGVLRFRAAVAVAQQLLDGGVHRIGRGGIGNLGFHHHERNNVHEQYDVRDDAALPAARRVDAELVDGVETDALRVHEVDQSNYRVGLEIGRAHV